MKLNIQLFADGGIVIDTKLDTKSFDAQITELESKLEDLEETYKIALQDPEFGEKNLQDLQADIEKTSNKLVDMYKKKRLLEQGNQFEGMKGALGDIIKKVGKWSIAIFGIRSAYNFVRGAISTLSQSNKNLAKDIENIRYGLASALQPVIQKIVQWAYKLMQAINYIWKVMTGKNLFSNMKKDLKSSSKSAKEIQKTVASFDEMNVLSDSSSGGGTGGDVGNFTEDLTDTNLLSEKQKKTLEDIAKVLKDLWDNILKPLWEDVLKPIGEWLLDHPKVLLGLLTAIIGLKIGSKIAGITGAIGTGSTGLIGALALLDVYLISKIVKDIKNELIPTIKDTKQKIDEATEGVKSNTKATQNLNDKTIEYANSVEAGDKTLSNNIDFMLKKIKTTDKEIAKQKEQISVQGALTGENKIHKQAMQELDTQMWENINTLGILAENHKLTNTEAQSFVDVCQETINKLEEQNTKLSTNSSEYQNNKIKIEQLKAQIDKTKGNYNVNVNTKADKTKVDELKKSVDNVEGTHKVKFSADTNEANKKVNKWLSGMGSALFAVFFPGLAFAKTLAKFKYHAKGGIINQPGRGIPITHMGGESGREGVIPLTDSQQMELLGEAIGRYITINANIVNSMNGRVISRELQKIQSEDNFAGNR